MKRIGNLSVYKLLGYVILGVGAYALVNANTVETQATAPVPVPETNNQYSRSRHTITLVLNELDDLKVTEGQRVNVGDVISVRTSARAKLQAKKQRLTSALARASLPLRELKPVPEPKFQQELVNLKRAKFQLNSIVEQIDNFDEQLQFKDEWLSTVFESEKIQQLADLKRQELEASINLEKAIASLDEAKLNYQKQQYEHSLKVSDYQTLMQRQQEQITSLQTQLDKVDEELDKLTSVYSPYRGKVRRVKILGQNERTITAEVTLELRDGR